MGVAQIREFYLESVEATFDKASLLRRFRTKYEDDQLAGKLKGVIGEDTTRGSDALRTLAADRDAQCHHGVAVARVEQPSRDVQQPERRAQNKACNLDIPLCRLVRASTAAPTYFPPEVVYAGGQVPFLMVDGGATMYNNPAHLPFLMATVQRSTATVSATSGPETSSRSTRPRTGVPAGHRPRRRETGRAATLRKIHAAEFPMSDQSSMEKFPEMRGGPASLQERSRWQPTSRRPVNDLR